MPQSPDHRIRKPCIALVGRPNVGKSTLFNRLVGERQAVVSEVSGTTRDRIYGEFDWNGVPFRVVDTGGFDTVADGELAQGVQRHLQRALDESDLFVFLCDAKEGVTQEDSLLMDRLRRLGKPTVLAANKLEDGRAVPAELYAFGVQPVCPISAMHGQGVGDLLDQVLRGLSDDLLKSAREQARLERIPAIAILGRQNVGKSSLFNALLQEERVIVSSVPGTTRDAIDTYLEFGERNVKLIDTAGLKLRRKVRDSLDFFSMTRTVKSIERSHVALVVLDATQKVSRDDHRILARVIEERRGLVIVLNKWDLVQGMNHRELARSVEASIPYARHAPMIVASAKTGFGVFRALSKAVGVYDHMEERLPAEEILQLLQAAWVRQSPPKYRGRVLLLKRVQWVSPHGTGLLLVTTPIGRIPASYQQYLLKQLHKHPAFAGVPLTLHVREPVRRGADDSRGS